MNYHNTTDDPSDGWSNHWSNGEQEESKELPESKHIDKIIDFAEQIAAEDEAEIKGREKVMATKKEILKIIKESNLDPASVIHAIEEENGDICAILWSVDDFKDRAFILNKCTGNDYDESKMEGALKEMRRKHDYNIGISWDTVDYFLDEYCLIEK